MRRVGRSSKPELINSSFDLKALHIVSKSLKSFNLVSVLNKMLVKQCTSALKRSTIKLVTFSSFFFFRCKQAWVKVHAMDFLTHAKVERIYNASNFPEALILPGDHGFSVQLVCRRNQTSSKQPENIKVLSDAKSETVDVTNVVDKDDDYEGDETPGDEVGDVGDGDNELESIGVHFVCPPNDPQVPLPCIHSLTEGKVDEESDKTIPRKVEYEEVPRERMQR